MGTAVRFTLAAGGLALAATAWAGTEWKSAEPVRAGGAPIDVEVGHAAPLVVDWDGDGLDDLLVGQFGDGRLRIYRNLGVRGAPRFDGHTFFEAGGKTATIPSG